jgi:hypothetical protein
VQCVNNKADYSLNVNNGSDFVSNNDRNNSIQFNSVATEALASEHK